MAFGGGEINMLNGSLEITAPGPGIGRESQAGCLQRCQVERAVVR